MAVAAGQAALTVGTDTGGSVRVPAALCGVTGLKPTFGLISRYGATPLAWSMDHVGPLARSVLDSALALNALSGHDPRDPASLRVPPRDYAAGLERGAEGAAGTRIGVVESFGWDLTEPGVRTAFDAAMERLQTLGADVGPAVTPELALINAAGSVVQTAEAAALHRDRVLRRGREMDQAIRRRIESGLFIPAEAYLHAQRVRAALRRQLLSTLDEVDLLASPTTAIAAPMLDQQSVTIQGREVHIREGLLRVTRVFSAVGLPAISVPCGFTEDMLPVGLQLVGRPLSEPLLLRVAHAYQMSTEWHLQFPRRVRRPARPRLPVGVSQRSPGRNYVAHALLQLLRLREPALLTERPHGLAVRAYVKDPAGAGNERHLTYVVLERCEQLLCDPGRAEHPPALRAVLDLYP